MPAGIFLQTICRSDCMSFRKGLRRPIRMAPDKKLQTARNFHWKFLAVCNSGKGACYSRFRLEKRIIKRACNGCRARALDTLFMCRRECLTMSREGVLIVNTKSRRGRQWFEAARNTLTAQGVVLREVYALRDPAQA